MRRERSRRTLLLPEDERQASMSQESETRKWARQNLGKAKLGDVRRQRRLVEVAEAMARKPGASLPCLCETRYDLKASYNLFRHPDATPDNLQDGHRKLVLRALGEAGTESLLLEDTSEVSWNTSFEIPGLGPTGDRNPRVKGFLLHSTLAVRWSAPVSVDGPYRRAAVDVLGLADQRYHVRQPVPAGEDPDRSSGPRRLRPRESDLWNDTTERLGPAPARARWVRVCDRAADIYEFLAGCKAHGHGFVVRAAQDRALVDAGERLFARARALPGQGAFCLHVRERKERPAHEARLQMAWAPVSLRSPGRPGASVGHLPPVPCTVVRIWEPEAPAGSKPLEWLLLVDRPVERLDEALTVALQYATRWVIEDFHKALKTGLGAERLHLEDGHALVAAVSVMSVAALRLVDLRERLRIAPDAPATEAGLDPLELRILAKETKRHLATTRDVALALGRMGGHLNRKADGMPGLLTLWHGLYELQMLARGARLGMHLARFG